MSTCSQGTLGDSETRRLTFILGIHFSQNRTTQNLKIGLSEEDDDECRKETAAAAAAAATTTTTIETDRASHVIQRQGRVERGG